MVRFVQSEERTQHTFLPSCLEDYIAKDNSVRVVDVFVGELDLNKLGFEGMHPQATGRPGYHPSTMLKIYLYGYLNRIQSSRRLEREAQRNVELMWLTGRLMPDFKTIANFRKNNGPAIRAACRQFIVLCRQLNLLSRWMAASSRRLTTETGTSPVPSCSGGLSRSKRASIAICLHSTPQIKRKPPTSRGGLPN
jgi:transposase